MLHSIFYQILLTAALLGCALVRALPVNNTLDKRQSAGVYRTCGGSGQYASASLTFLLALSNLTPACLCC